MHGIKKRNRRRRRRHFPVGRAAFLLAALCGVWALLVFPIWRELESRGRAMEEYIGPASSQAEDGPVCLEVPVLDQREKYPAGCESVALAMALQYAGVDVTPDEIIEAMPKGSAPYPDGLGGYIGCDPREAFSGDPYSSTGWGCYAPVVLKTAEDILRERDGTSLSVKDLTGSSLSELCGYLRENIPVLIWGTVKMRAAEPDITITIEGTEETFQWLYPMHCLLLVGVDDSHYLFNDPLEGKITAYPKADTERAYNALGKQALAIEKRR